jgi:SAM-dependent methyltransferase
MTRAVREAWARPADLAPAAARLIASDARIGAMIERAARAWPVRLGVDEALDLRGLGDDALLHALLTNAPLRDLPLERLLVGVRAALLTRAESSHDDGDATLELHAALARQCFVNEYVWAESGEETQRVARLGERLRAAMEHGEAVPAAWLAAFASYRPLSARVEARRVERAWPPAIAALIDQQIRAPGEEARLRPSLARLTPIDDAISLRVQGQYEENPYPRWVALPPGLPDPLEARLRQRFPRAPLRPLARGIETEILIAGCGTGQEAIETAEENPQSRVLAIDLSAASLAYAQRMSAARGVRNVDYAQADILKLGALGRRFDAISSVGVLHHLDDPLAGWRILCGLLRPGGVMRIGLYSERARRGIAQARRYVAQRGYPATAAGIRRAREDLAADAAFEPITALRDFHTTSECRDLLFHVQEHEFTLPQIAEALGALDLTLLGFVLEPQVVRAYAQRFADDPAAVDLGNWSRFEADHPETFLGMYVMWLQKA